MIHALHGNFGLPSDWDASLPPGVPAKAWHLWEIRRHHPEARTLTGFAAWFNNQIEALPPDPRRILAGYSLGGRLALHVLLDRPALWHAALLISTHPGLTTEAERAARLAHDARWRERCLIDSWEHLIRDWNAQPVLAGPRQSPPPGSTGTWRGEIAEAFRDWSLGCQTINLSGRSQFPVKGIWMTGGNDSKFCALGQSTVETVSTFRLRILPQAGHRLLTEAPDIIMDSLTELAA